MGTPIISVKNVSKIYRLGTIGSTTLREELHRVHDVWFPPKNQDLLPQKNRNYRGEQFYALSDVSFDVMRGERIGIIGHNGAGKSTLLKLISRITTPSTGYVGLNGKTASMLEVGTGFNGELTGRENIYINGALLGMKRKEIDAKIDDIIQFSECSQFIDTPVKRYSSGMYLKLAFAVAAHLDTEILIMDEIFAVGDMAFQRKCLDKMETLSRDEGRTILCVSHNMNTIRQLCQRCIVLSHGHVVFDGDVDRAIEVYMETGSVITDNKNHVTFPLGRHECYRDSYYIDRLDIEREDNVYSYGEVIPMVLTLKKKNPLNGDMYLQCVIRSKDGFVTMTSSKDPIPCNADTIKIAFNFDTSILAPAKYTMSLFLYEAGKYAANRKIDILREAYPFSVEQNETLNHGIEWRTDWWGYHVAKQLDVRVVEYKSQVASHKD